MSDVMNHTEKEKLLSEYYPGSKFSRSRGELLMTGKKAEILFAGATEGVVRWKSSDRASQKAKHFQLDTDADILSVLEEFEKRES